MTTLSILFVGLLLGMKHATDADHLAAVATLATQQNSLPRVLWQGVAWGVGHTLTLMLFAGAVLLLEQEISADLEQALETGVGVMLVLLGGDVLRRQARDRVQFRVHRNDPGPAHEHAHARRLPVRALAVGMMHGLAGSAALVVLSLQSVPSVTLGLGYIALFGAGSIVGMAMLSAAIAVPLRLSAVHLSTVYRGMTTLVGILTLALGLSVIWQTGLLRAWVGS